MCDKTTDLLQKLQSGEITLEDCQKELNTSTPVVPEVTYKVSPKSGCICFYGLRRMPISIYRGELDKILDELLDPGYKYNKSYQTFLEENEGIISIKK